MYFSYTLFVSYRFCGIYTQINVYTHGGPTYTLRKACTIIREAPHILVCWNVELHVVYNQMTTEASGSKWGSGNNNPNPETSDHP